MITVVVYGDPAPQGSKNAQVIRGGQFQCPRCTRRGLIWRKGSYCPVCKQGAPVVTLTEAAVGHVKWRNAVFAAARVVMLRERKLAGPLSCSLTLTLARPKNHWTRKAALTAEGKRHPYPEGTPDLSKLLRATEDALTDGGVWEDDSRVVLYTRLAKVWATGPQMPKGTVSLPAMPMVGADHAMPVQGAYIVITQLIQPQDELDLGVVSDTRIARG